MCLRIEVGPIPVIGQRARIRFPIVRRRSRHLRAVYLEYDAIGLSQCGGDGLRHFGLELQQLPHLQVFVVHARPDDRTVVPIQEPYRQSKLIAIQPNAALECVTGGLTRRCRSARERRMLHRYDDLLEFCELPDDFFRQAPCDQRRVLSPGQILERLDNQPWHIGCFKPAATRTGDGATRRTHQPFRGRGADEEKQQRGNGKQRPLRQPRPLRRGRGHAHRHVALRRHEGLIAPRKRRHVPALRDGDDNRIVLAGRKIVALESSPYAPGLDADDGIGLRFERGVATKNLRCNRVGLDAIRPAGDRFLDDIGQEIPRSLRHIEIRTRSNQAELRAQLSLGGRGQHSRRATLLDRLPMGHAGLPPAPPVRQTPSRTARSAFSLFTYAYVRSRNLRPCSAPKQYAPSGSGLVCPMRIATWGQNLVKW